MTPEQKDILKQPSQMGDVVYVKQDGKFIEKMELKEKERLKMEYQNNKENERFLEKMERDKQKMLLKYYDLKTTDANCPKNTYLLRPENLHLSSYEVLPDNRIKLNVGYTTTWNGFVNSDIRKNYNQYIIGTLYCEEVKFVKDLNFNKRAKISIPFFSKSKILNIPVQNTHNVLIRCKSIKVSNIDIYVKDSEDKFVLAEFYKEKLGSRICIPQDSLKQV